MSTNRSSGCRWRRTVSASGTSLTAGPQSPPAHGDAAERDRARGVRALEGIPAGRGVRPRPRRVRGAPVRPDPTAGRGPPGQDRSDPEVGKEPIERKLLASFRASLELREPARLPQTLLESFFGYMIKEGVKANHVRALAADGRKALDASRKRARGPTAPGMRALVQLACNGLNEILKVVESELRDPEARAEIEALLAANRRDAKAFDLPGFSPEGTFDETYALFKRVGCGLGRSRSYARALRDFWDD